MGQWGGETESSYIIDMPFFKGPIELLYFLIQKKSLDITTISLSNVTEDFLTYAHYYKRIHHQDIAEFLNIASQLIYLKSLRLLPFENEDLDEKMDERQEFIERLIEYGKMKKGFEFLKNQKTMYLIERSENDLLLKKKKQYQIQEIKLNDLIEKISIFFKPAPEIPLSRGEITLDIMSVEERMHWLKKLLNRFIKMSFFRVLKKLFFVDQVMSFIALLELSKKGEMQISQEEPFGDMIIEAKKIHEA